MEIEQFIHKQPKDRQTVLSNIHQVIIENDKGVTVTVEPMMGKEMILYKTNETMKYALSSVKNHISLHLMPIYCSPELHGRFKTRLPKASFQKGCINFKKEADMPIETVADLIKDCALVDIVKIIQDYQTSNKTKK